MIAKKKIFKISKIVHGVKRAERCNDLSGTKLLLVFRYQ